MLNGIAIHYTIVYPHADKWNGNAIYKKNNTSTYTDHCKPAHEKRTGKWDDDIILGNTKHAKNHKIFTEFQIPTSGQIPVFNNLRFTKHFASKLIDVSKGVKSPEGLNVHSPRHSRGVKVES